MCFFSGTIMINIKKGSGFTLMELMIVVAIIGIIATIALPSYQEFVQKSRRSEAHAGLAKMQLQQEAHRMVNNSFTNSFGTGSNNVHLPTSDYYTFTMSNASASAYTLTAAAKSSQTADTTCTPMTINQAGTKSPAACW